MPLWHCTLVPGGRPRGDTRVAASLAAATIAVLGGATILRVHDVAATVQAVRVARATLAGR